MKLSTISLVVIFYLTGFAYSESMFRELTASWYSEQSLKSEGTWTKSKGIMANGQKFNEDKLTCATRLFPLGTTLKITNKNNGKSVCAVVTDRIGKRFANSRIDLSKGAFKRIANLDDGLCPVVVDVISIKE